MIKVVIFKGSGFELTGHSGYAEEGSDIVCAAVSAIAQFAIMGISETNKISCDFECDNGIISLHLANNISQDEKRTAIGYLDTFEIMIKQLSEQYNKYLKITVMEE